MLTNIADYLRSLGDTKLDEDRDEVLQVAREVLLDFGVQRATMSEIARRSSVSQATIYRWFDGKDQIVRLVMMREARALLAELQAVLDADAAPDEQLIEIAVVIALRIHEQPLLKRFLRTDPDLILPKVTLEAGAMLDMGSRFLAAHIDGLMRSGDVPEGNAAAIAELLTRAVHSLFLTPSTVIPLDDEVFVREVIGDVIRALLRLP